MDQRIRRRDFLDRCWRAASIGLIRRDLYGFRPPTRGADGEFHLHPVFSTQPALDSVLTKVPAGHDDFINEKYHDQIAVILRSWTAGLLRSPVEIGLIEKSLAPDFLGPIFRSTESRVLRSTSTLESRRITFGGAPSLSRVPFLEQFRNELSSLSQILNVDLQITQIGMKAGLLQTRVLFELVGSGEAFYRDQRTGFWDLEWEAAPSGEFQLKSWRATEEQRSRSTRPWYSDISARTLGGNASYKAQLLHGVDYWRTVLDGACGIDIYGHNGVSVGDIDNDGFDDLYICQPAGLPNRLFRNRRDGTFEDITEASGTGILENTACALFADFNNDGWQDLLVVRSTGPLLFVNEGGGHFRRKPDAFQFATLPQGTFTGAAAADYDRDGWLDVYFCLYVYYQGTDQYKYPVPYHAAENGPPNFLMRNNGDGTFRDVTAQSGLDRNNTRYSFCCSWGDHNGDGWPDLYVVNDFGRKNLYRNNGDGTFTDIAEQAGVLDVGAGMSVCWFDYDNDMAQDLYVADMWTAAGERISVQENFKKSSPEAIRALYRKHAMGNSLFRNIDGARFRDTTSEARVGMGRWSWSSDAWDFDHDGYPDLYIANGMLSGSLHEDLNSFFWRQVVANSPDNADPSAAYEQAWNAINELIRSDYSWSGYERNVFYANNRDGTFSDVSASLGLDFVEDGRAFALSDFDHDGRYELFLKNRNAPQLRVLKNILDDLPPAIAINLSGTRSNRDAIGATVTVETGTLRQTRMLQAGSGFLSQHSKELFFGVASNPGPARATVRWPSGLVQHFEGLPINHRIRIVEGRDEPALEPFAKRDAAAQANLPETQPAEDLPNEVETWLLAPVPAPNFSLPDLDGKMYELSTLRGKRILLIFHTTSSPHCEADLVMLSSQLTEWKTQNIYVLAVNFDDGKEAEAVLAALIRQQHLQFPMLRGSDDVAGVYTLLYRYVFDRHRDISLPTSFLITEQGDIVKIYQGRVNPGTVSKDLSRIPQNDAERLTRALPFPGVSDTFEFGRNHLSFGSVYFRHGYLDQAEASFLLALRDDPSSAEANYGLGSVYLKREKIDQARECFERTVKGKATYPNTLPCGWNNLGLIAARAGRTEEAVGYFQQALLFSPNYPIALLNLGNAYRQEHQWDKAQQALVRAVALAPDDPEPNYSLAMVFAQMDQSDRAYEYLRKALKLRPNYPEALNNLGVLDVRTRRLDEAVANFTECIRIAPGFDQAYLNLAKVYALEGETEKARHFLLQLLKQQPNHLQAQKALQELR